MTMTEETDVQVDVADGVATITLNRPDALNAFTPPMLERLAAAVTEADVDPEVQVIVLTGAGRAFSAGVDLKALGDRDIIDGAVGDILDIPARQVVDRLAFGSTVSIAKVNGFCFTGALEIALACDLMVTADEATLADTHAKFGLRPSWGMSQRLPAAVGKTKARELSLTARNIKGIEAAAIGMACTSVPLAELDATVADMAATIAGNSTGSLAAYKDLFAASERLGLQDGLAYEYATPYTIADSDERLASFR